MRLSPLSVPYRTVRRGASVGFTVGLVVLSFTSVLGGTVGTLVGVALVGCILLALVGYEIAYWKRYEYELTADTIDIRSGVVARRNREIPLRRVHNVDISRDVIQRLLGIAAVDLETAGGGETEAAIRYVNFDEARRLQREIAGLKRDAKPAEETDETGEDEELFALTTRELALVGAFSFDRRSPGVAFLVISGVLSGLPGFDPEGVPAPVTDLGTELTVAVLALVLVLVVLVSWGAGATVAILNYYDFRLRRVGDELQYERGLLRRYNGSIPLDKVQTLTVADNPLKRRFDYATLYIETAGYAPGGSSGDERGSKAAVPLAKVDRVHDLASEIETFGDPEFDRPPSRVRRRYVLRYAIGIAVVTAGLYAADSVVGLGVPWVTPLVALPVVPVAAHLKWRHRGYWLGDDHVVTRNGVLHRKTKVVPYYRIQTVIDSRTIVQRRWRLGTVTADTAGSLSLGGDDAAAVDVDDDDAELLREALADRLYDALADRATKRRERATLDAPVDGGRERDDSSAPEEG